MLSLSVLQMDGSLRIEQISTASQMYVFAVRAFMKDGSYRIISEYYHSYRQSVRMISHFGGHCGFGYKYFDIVAAPYPSCTCCGSVFHRVAGCPSRVVPEYN